MDRNIFLNTKYIEVSYTPLFGPKVEMKIYTDKENYLPGDEIKARVSILSNKRFGVEEVRLELICRSTLEYNVVRRYSATYPEDENPDEFVYEKRTFELFKIRERIMEKGEIPTREINLEKNLKIPADAPPTFIGSLIKTNWVIKAVVSRGFKRDIVEEKTIKILGQITDNELMQPRELPSDLKDLSITINLPKFAYVLGEVIEGDINLRPLKNLKFNEIRVELICAEILNPSKILPVNPPSLSDFQGEHFHKIAQESIARNIDLRENLEHKFQFRLNIPNIQKPTCETDYYKVDYYLKFTCARKFRGDFNVNIPIILTNSTSL